MLSKVNSPSNSWFRDPLASLVWNTGAKSWVDQFKLTGGHNCGELGTTVPGWGTVPEEIFPEVTAHRVPGGVLGYRFDPICHGC